MEAASSHVRRYTLIAFTCIAALAISVRTTIGCDRFSTVKRAASGHLSTDSFGDMSLEVLRLGFGWRMKGRRCRAEECRAEEW